MIVVVFIDRTNTTAGIIRGWIEIMFSKKEFEDAIIPITTFEESAYRASNGDRWSAKLLYEEANAQKCIPFKLLLENIDYTQKPYGETSRLTDMAFHMKRSLDSDLSYPVLIGPLGNIMDGFHRILKATITGKKHVMAYRLKKLPKPDGKE